MLAWLRREHPPGYPVTARRVPGLLVDCSSWPVSGLCEFPIGKGRRFRISICSRQSWALQTDSLLHEWAHALTWFGADARQHEDHGPEWGLTYGQLYREFLVWDYGRGSAE